MGQKHSAEHHSTSPRRRHSSVSPRPATSPRPSPIPPQQQPHQQPRQQGVHVPENPQYNPPPKPEAPKIDSMTLLLQDLSSEKTRTAVSKSVVDGLSVCITENKKNDLATLVKYLEREGKISSVSKSWLDREIGLVLLQYKESGDSGDVDELILAAAGVKRRLDSVAAVCANGKATLPFAREISSNFGFSEVSIASLVHDIVTGDKDWSHAKKLEALDSVACVLECVGSKDFLSKYVSDMFIRLHTRAYQDSAVNMMRFLMFAWKDRESYFHVFPRDVMIMICKIVAATMNQVEMDEFFCNSIIKHCTTMRHDAHQPLKHLQAWKEGGKDAALFKKFQDFVNDQPIEFSGSVSDKQAASRNYNAKVVIQKPKALVPMMDSFERLWKDAHMKDKLQFPDFFGEITLGTPFGTDFIVCPAQYAVLELFEREHCWKVHEIREMLIAHDDDSKGRALLDECMKPLYQKPHQVLIKSGSESYFDKDDTLTINDEFSFSGKCINFLSFSRSVAFLFSDTSESDRKNREFQIQAFIVRLLKRRREMMEKEVQSETMEKKRQDA